MPSLLPTDRLLRPRELHPYVQTPAGYRRAQMRAIRQQMAAFPNLNWQWPWRYFGTVALKVSDSQWQLVCACGNYPLYDPEWELACCYTCGAVYEQAPPSDWREIERVLVNRPRLNNRHMLVGQPLADLIAENFEHGDPA